LSRIDVYFRDFTYLEAIPSEGGLIKELYDYFAYFVPGYRFMPKFKAKMWDGKIRLYDGVTGALYVGLFSKLQAFAKERDLEIVVHEEGMFDKDVVDDDDFEGFIRDVLNPHVKGEPIAPYDYQFSAMLHALRERRTLLLSATSSGKSFMIYTLIRYLEETGKASKFLVVVPSTGLVEQMVSDFADYASEVDWDEEEQVHMVYGGAERHTDKPITLSTWQSLQKMPKSFFDQFDFVLVDECHQAKANSIKGIVEKCTKAYYRFGTTGTLDGIPTNRLVLEGLFGKVHDVVRAAEMTEKTGAPPAKVYGIILKYDEHTCQAMRKASYREEIDFIVSSERRIKYLRNLALSCKGNTLLLFNYVEKHGKPLLKAIAEKDPSRPLFYIAGEVGTKEREAIRKIMEQYDNAIIVASYGTMSTGISINKIHNIIFAAPSKSRIRVLQSIGRGLRKHGSKTRLNVFDIADDLRIGKHVNFTLQHFFERLRFYDEEHFEYGLYPVDV